jgi:hypothetical protein
VTNRKRAAHPLSAPFIALALAGCAQGAAIPPSNAPSTTPSHDPGQPCYFLAGAVEECESEVGTVVVDFQFPTDAEGCTFEVTIDWGEPNANGWAQLSGHPGDVAHAARHEYTRAGEYRIKVSGTANRPRCEVDISRFWFTLLPAS